MQLFLAFIVALSVTAALIPLLERWAPSIGLTDAPGPRKVHANPIPRVGGLAMAAGVYLATLITVDLTRPIRGFLLGLAVLILFGTWDDRVTLGYRAKFAGQVIAVVACMVVGGVQVGQLEFGSLELLPAWAATLVTFLFLIGITNAVNLADGLDGLAGGLVLLCLCAVALFAIASTKLAVTAVALIEAGAILGFLRFNTHPARIFMGDSGSQMLGFSVGVLALLATRGESSPVSAALPLLLLGLPILDTLMVMLTRMREGRSPFSADRNHLHHQLLSLGFAHREAVLLIYVMQAGLVLLAYFLRFESDLDVILAFCVFAGSLLGLLHWAKHSGRRIKQIERSSVRLRRCLNRLGTRSTRIPGLALGLMAACLATYATAVLASGCRVGPDIGIMCAVLLALLVLLTIGRAQRSLQLFERATAYVGVVLLVYFDQTAADRPPLLGVLSWAVIALTGAAAIVRFWLSPGRKFELTTLDLIVIFVALVLPNLPGIVPLPADLPAGIAKAVILLYVVEMLLTATLNRMLPRVFLGLMLAVIAGRALIGLAL